MTTPKPLPETKDFAWFEASLISFNGSGYADRRTPESFLDSYILYKLWRNKPLDARTATVFYRGGLNVTRFLLDTSPGPSRLPNQRNYQKFQKFCAEQR